jgi:hypothetical protein
VRSPLRIRQLQRRKPERRLTGRRQLREVGIIRDLNSAYSEEAERKKAAERGRDLTLS